MFHELGHESLEVTCWKYVLFLMHVKPHSSKKKKKLGPSEKGKFV